MIVKKRSTIGLFSALIITVTLLSSSLISANLTSVETEVGLHEISNASIILMIGDGMGFGQIELANLVEYVLTDNLTMEKLPFYASVRTLDYDNEITDSSAAATAMATGNKTKDGYLGVNHNKEVLENIIEIAHILGKSTGIATTHPIYGDTPAAFMVHGDINPFPDQVMDQIVHANVSLLFGGGSDYLTVEGNDTLLSYGYNIVYTRDEFLTLNESKAVGLFAGELLPEELYKNKTLIPSIAEMTTKALEILSLDEDGFFLMVEGSQIDWGAHENDVVYTALEAIAFDYAVKVAYEYVQTHTNTILIVTADHETGGLDIVSNTLDDTLPMDLVSEEDILNQRILRANDITVTWEKLRHTGKHVPLYIYGEAFNECIKHSMVYLYQLLILLLLQKQLNQLKKAHFM
ncbi:MAG: alkaline phosphatase [Candidatus Heimdallarchaeaceae archaeon]